MGIWLSVPSFSATTGPPADFPMAHSCPDPDAWAWAPALQVWHLNRCWVLECDIDPMLLRARQLRHQGALPQASCVEQELLPLF